MSLDIILELAFILWHNCLTTLVKLKEWRWHERWNEMRAMLIQFLESSRGRHAWTWHKPNIFIPQIWWWQPYDSKWRPKHYITSPSEKGSKLKKDADGGGNIRLKKKVIELHYFKEWKVGTSLCASMLEDPNLKFLSSGTSVNRIEEDKWFFEERGKSLELKRWFEE